MLFEITVPQFQKMLGNLEHILDKAMASADTRKFDSKVFMTSRLAPDQFDFTRQVQIATDTAKLCVQRLTGVEAKSHDDKETTMAELKTRVGEVRQYFAKIKPENFSGAAEKRISTKFWEGKSLSGEEFVLQQALPNFFFHVTTAYEILRHNGVDLGKKDYIGTLPLKN